MWRLLYKVGDILDRKLSEIQLDALREVGNIGAGNSATALSQMMGKRIDMSLPQVNILSFEDMIKRVGTEEEIVVAVLLKVFGDAPGNILFLMKQDKAQEFAETILGGFSEVTDEIYLSLFQEVGNILGNSYINAISRLTSLSLLTSVPAISIDMLAAVLSSSFMDAQQYSDYVLAIDTNFIEDGKKSGGNFFYIPKPGSLDIILTKLGLN